MHAHSLVPHAFALVTLSSAALAQCTDWKPGFHLPGANHYVLAFASHDDGSGAGEEVYFAGQFTRFGGEVARHVVKWDGVRYAEVGGGLPYDVSALCAFDDGAGEDLYAATVTSGAPLGGVARWNGTSWADLPGGFNVRGVTSMVVHDDGSGPAIYVAGFFPSAIAPEVYLRSVARFDGTSWSAVGTESPGGPTGGGVLALAVFDDGTGPALYAGGSFVDADGSTARNLARWDGNTWSEVGGGVGHGLNENVRALATWHDAQGAARLVVGGIFTDAGGVPARNLALWDGVAWSTTGSGSDYQVESLTVARHALGADDLYAAGAFDSVDGVPATHAARWDGTAWSALGPGLGGVVLEIAAVERAGGTHVYAGGGFTSAGEVGVGYVAEWSPASSTWSAHVDGNGVWSGVSVLRALDDGDGTQLYAGGNFQTAGGAVALHVARFDGVAWSPMGAGLTDSPGGSWPHVAAFAAYDDGNGPAIYAGGSFRVSGATPVASIARWNGTSWQPVGGGLTKADGGYARVQALVVFDDGGGPRLYAGGDFDRAGGTPAGRLARWNGTTWSPVGGGFDGSVEALAVYDDGLGAKLYAGGGFFHAGPTSARRIARWNGTTWSQVGAGAGHGNVAALYPFDAGDGAGLQLYAAGGFWELGIPDTFMLGRWNGTSWSSIGAGTGSIPDSNVRELVAFDDGTGGGAKLYAAGLFATIDGVPSYGIARFDGAGWSALGGAPSAAATTLAVFAPEGGASDLLVGGWFTTTGSVESVGIARFGSTGASGCADDTGTSTCAGDGSATSCPCANFGASGRGCQNSSSTGGGRLRASGQAHLGADTVRLVADFLPSATIALFLQGTQAQACGFGTAFGDGLRCAGGSVTRLRTRHASSGVVELGEGIVGDPAISAAGHVTRGPTTRWYQVWYRDANPSFCTSSTFNLTNALAIRWVD